MSISLDPERVDNLCSEASGRKTSFFTLRHGLRMPLLRAEIPRTGAAFRVLDMAEPRRSQANGNSA